MIEVRPLLTAAFIEQRGALVRSIVGMSFLEVWIAWVSASFASS
jgi:hypothetical protein